MKIFQGELAGNSALVPSARSCGSSGATRDESGLVKDCAILSHSWGHISDNLFVV